MARTKVGVASAAPGAVTEVVKAVADVVAVAMTPAKQEAPPAPADRAALGGSFFGGTNTMPGPPPTAEPRKQAPVAPATPEIPPAAVPSTAEGERITVTRGEEMFGKPGSFSTYRVGPFTVEGRVRPGENYQMATARLLAELNQVFDAAFDVARAKFLAHFEKAFS
jgi:hypothetical protein